MQRIATRLTKRTNVLAILVRVQFRTHDVFAAQAAQERGRKLTLAHEHDSFFILFSIYNN